MRRLVAVGAVALVVVGCGGPEESFVEGIVVAVDGDITEVRTFTVVDGDGESHTFVPTEGLTFDDGPLSHLSAHITSGEPVRVGYETEADGTLTAVSIEDA